MFSSQILDVAIGLALMYLFQAILVSGINEVLVAVVAARGKQMRKYLAMAMGGSIEASGGLFDKFVQSPFIKSLQRKGRFPSYISTKNFSQAVVETLGRDEDLSADAIKKLRTQLDSLSDSDFKRILKAKLDVAEDSIETFKAGMEEWYSEYMERVSHWYGQKAKFFLYLFAFVVTVALNVDSFKVMNELWKSEKMRESVVGMATKAAQEDILKDSINGHKDSLSVAIGKIQNGYNKLRILDYPITWEYEYAVVNNVSDASLNDQSILFKLQWAWGQMTLEKLLGFIVTTLAVSIGAPIWYDIIKGLVKAREVIKK